MTRGIKQTQGNHRRLGKKSSAFPEISAIKSRSWFLQMVREANVHAFLLEGKAMRSRIERRPA
jgi:hypothetical protein